MGDSEVLRAERRCGSFGKRRRPCTHMADIEPFTSTVYHSVQGAVQGNRRAAVLLRASLEDAFLDVRDLAWRWHVRVVRAAASWLGDERTDSGLELLTALAQLGDRHALLAAADRLGSSSVICRQAAVDILGEGASQGHPLAVLALAMCIPEADQELEVNERILKAKQSLSTSSRDILHALDGHLEVDALNSIAQREAGEQSQQNHHEIVHQALRHLAAEGPTHFDQKE